MNYRKARNIFALLLLLSLAIFAIVILIPQDSTDPGFDADDALLLGTIFGGLSALAAVVSAIGTVVTTILAWRQDKRQQIEHEMKIAAAEESEG